MTASAQVSDEAPPLICRWLHGGAPLDDLTSLPLAGPSNSNGGNGAASNETSGSSGTAWRSFSESENQRLEAAWQKLDEEAREKAWTSKAKMTTPKSRTSSMSGKSSAPSSRRNSTFTPESDEKSTDSRKKDAQDQAEQESEDKDQAKERAQESYIADPEKEQQPHIVHVSQDNLFSADLLSLSLYPVFWKGARVGIQRATWFYPSTSVHKFYPLDPLLAHHLEEAYHEISPYEASYADELKSAVEIGADAETKLKHYLPEVGVDVIFQGPTSARLYARNLPARLSKSFLTSFIRDKGTGGGTLVYRGYDVLQDHLPEKKKKAIARKQQLKDEASGGPRTKESIANLKAEAAAAEHGVSDSDSEHATDSLPSSPAKASATKSKSGLSSLFSLAYSSKSKISATNDADEVEAGDDNTTAEAMEDTKSPDDGQAEQELAELVLIVHGIGQKLATTYDSFNIVHAINQMRKICNKQSRDPELAQVIGNKRLQFIPLQWRTSLQFDEMTGDEDDRSAQLDNRFALKDIQVQGAIPFVRSLMTGVAMDLGFYLSHHRDKMTAAVIRDANRIYRLFRQRNPNFNGRVSIIAHSLGTALATDILSRQPTWVKDMSELPPDEQRSDKQLLFNVSSLFFLGSPVGYMFFLNRAQLIARQGRERTKNVPPEIALDRVGKYGCMAIDSIYNIYNVLDPFACCLNACVDAEYAKIVKPVHISSVTSSMFADYTAKVSHFLGSLMPSIPSFGSSTAASASNTRKNDAELAKNNGDDGKSAEQRTLEEDIKPKRPAMPMRPKTKRQLTSELDKDGLRRFERAEARMLALNPQGSIDFDLQSEGFSQYYDMLLSHASYWTDVRFTTFILTQLLASKENIAKSKADREAADEHAANAEHLDTLEIKH